MCNFKIGQKVVCVKPADNLIKNEIYTIQAVLKPIWSDYGLLLEETSSIGAKGAFKATRFRPLDETFATELLANITEQVKREELILT